MARKVSKKPKLGSGARFKAIASKAAKQYGSAARGRAVAAAVGMKKYGKQRMAKMAAAGRKRAARARKR